MDFGEVSRRRYAAVKMAADEPSRCVHCIARGALRSRQQERALNLSIHRLTMLTVSLCPWKMVRTQALYEFESGR